MFVLQKFLGANELGRVGLSSFDEWCKNFARATSEYEMDMREQYKLITRLRDFENLPELKQMYAQFADVVTKEDLNNQIIAQGGKRVEPAPNYQSIIVEKSKELQEYMSEADLRLINPLLPRDPNGKVAKMTENILENYKKFRNFKGIQLIFCDRGIPSSKSNLSAVRSNIKSLESKLEKETDAGKIIQLESDLQTLKEELSAKINKRKL